MKLDPDDPKLTALALGEISGAEKIELEQRLSESPAAQRVVEETRALAAMLRNEFRDELEAAETKPRNIMPLPGPRNFWSDARWASLGIAAALAIGAFVTAILFSQGITARKTRAISQEARLPEVEMELATSELSQNQAADAAKNSAGENRFVSAATNPVSTFPLAIGTQSMSELQRLLAAGARPARDAVRIEEMVNYFAYDYPAPENGRVFSVNLEGAICPWETTHRLVRLGLRAGAGAREVRAEVKFNSALVDSYRLIGWEAGVEGAPAASDLPGGKEVTALYEIVPTGKAAKAKLLTAKLSYRNAASGLEEVAEQSLGQSDGAFEAASADFKFAAAIAEFGMLLRESPERGSGSFASAIGWARDGSGADTSGARGKFIELMRAASARLPAGSG